MDVNTTSTVGPLKFDCYSMTTTPNNGTFTNSLSFAQSQAAALPSWLSFDTTTANITATNPDTLGSDTYTITNTYTGVYGETITFTTDLNITVIDPSTVNNTTPNNTNTNNTNTNTTSSSGSNSDEDHCLGASSEALCGLLVTLIVVGALLPIIGIGVIVYCKFVRKRRVRPQSDNRVNQIQNRNDNQEVESVSYDPQSHALETEA